jgi:hypothetical protein
MAANNCHDSKDKYKTQPGHRGIWWLCATGVVRLLDDCGKSKWFYHQYNLALLYLAKSHRISNGVCVPGLVLCRHPRITGASGQLLPLCSLSGRMGNGLPWRNTPYDER